MTQMLLDGQKSPHEYAEKSRSFAVFKFYQLLLDDQEV